MDVIGVTYQFVPARCLTDYDGNNCPNGSTGTCYGCGHNSNQFNDNCLFNSQSETYYCFNETVYEGDCSSGNVNNVCNLNGSDYDWYIGQSNNACGFSSLFTQQNAACMALDEAQCYVSELNAKSVSWYTNTSVVPDGTTYVNNANCSAYGCNPLVSGRPINCTFDLNSNFNTVAQINEWLNIYGKYDLNNEVYNNTIMPYFCNRMTIPDDPDDQGCPSYNPIVTTSVCDGLTGCSRINAIGPAGQLCKSWADGGTSGGYQYNVDSVYTNFCGKHSCAQDCQCINADVVDPTFIEITTGNSSLAVDYPCWYIPCQSGTGGNYLVTSSLATELLTCPSEICEDVQDVINNQGTVNEVNSDYITCTNNTSTGTGQLTFVESIWDSYGVYILVGIGIVILIVIILIIVALVNKSKHKEKTK